METLSIVLPVYNERDSIEIVLKEWKNTLQKLKISYAFVICEDGSTDGTSTFLKKIKKKYNFQLSQVKKRRGYGGAVIDGIMLAKSTYILSIDSDGQCDPQDFSKIWNKKSKADVIIGWRKKRADAFQRKIFSKLFFTLHKILFFHNIHDPSAPFVLYKKETVFPYLKYLRYLKEGFWWGFIGMCIKKRLSLYEIKINHKFRLKGDTVVYKANKIPSIAIRNIMGLFKLKFSK